MSKYTTEVRFICENKSGLTESVGASDVDRVIANSWDKIFTTKVAFFDEEYRSALCSKILKHFYFMEIGCETVGMWVVWMNRKLEEVMPYYNQLYKSAKLEFNPFHDVDVTRTQNRTTVGTTQNEGSRKENTDVNTSKTGNNDTSSSSEATNDSTTSESKNSRDLYSDTPQGSISDLDSETYLTNARKVNDESNGTNHSSGSSTEKVGNDYEENGSQNTIVSGTTSDSGSSNTTENYIETLVGKQGGESYSDLLLKFRDTMLNIDYLVIEEFNDLFMGIW